MGPSPEDIEIRTSNMSLGLSPEIIPNTKDYMDTQVKELTQESVDSLVKGTTKDLSGEHTVKGMTKELSDSLIKINTSEDEGIGSFYTPTASSSEPSPTPGDCSTPSGGETFTPTLGVHSIKHAEVTGFVPIRNGTNSVKEMAFIVEVTWSDDRTHMVKRTFSDFYNFHFYLLEEWAEKTGCGGLFKLTYTLPGLSIILHLLLFIKH